MLDRSEIDVCDQGHLETSAVGREPPALELRLRRLGARLAALSAVLAGVAVLATSLYMSRAGAQGGQLILRPAGVLDDVKSVKDFCDHKRIVGMLGPPHPEIEDIEMPVYGMAFQFVVTSGAQSAKESFYIAILSYMNIEPLANQTTALLSQLGIPPDKARLTNYERCEPLFTSVAKKSSKAHMPLIGIVKKQTILGVTDEVVPVAALYLSHSGGLTGLLPPKAAAPPATIVPPKSDPPPGAPPKSDDAPVVPPKSDAAPATPPKSDVLPAKPVR